MTMPPARGLQALLGVAMVLAAGSTLPAQCQPLPSPIIPSPGTQHTVRSITYDHSSFEADPSLITQLGQIIEVDR
jgi:hypothetical protein